MCVCLFVGDRGGWERGQKARARSVPVPERAHTIEREGPLFGRLLIYFSPPPFLYHSPRFHELLRKLIPPPPITTPFYRANTIQFDSWTANHNNKRSISLTQTATNQLTKTQSIPFSCARPSLSLSLSRSTEHNPSAEFCAVLSLQQQEVDRRR